jgi:hypothetical protein
MPWDNIDINSINPNQDNLVDNGRYTMSIANNSVKMREGAVMGSIILDGDSGKFTGKKLSFYLPDPEAINKRGEPNGWASAAVRKVSVAVGEEVKEGEKVAEFLNRIAGYKFSATVTNKPDQNGDDRSNVNFGSAKPAV